GSLAITVTGLTPASVVQLRWTHNVNERKTVQTNMISFVSHGDKTLQRLIGMPGEQEHHISSVPFFFS
ncbi:MAG: hypothetical protein KBH28_08475, partial [Roseburia sp.]|nr:hypothetical protein [Roseburia sp.]